MSKYNIIYIAPDKTHYLYTPGSFDKLGDEDREVLHYTGASVNKDSLDDALTQCLEAVKKTSPATITRK